MTQKLRYVFGPVSSRRLGRSLGVDPVPFKTCNWNCVYCQLGRTAPLTNERRVHAPPREVVAEVGQALHDLGRGGVDWVTFAGSGEPTLHLGLGGMIRDVKEFAVPVAVLTNGSLLHREEVRHELLPADAVLTKLDAGSADIFRRIARPCRELTFERHYEGLRSFRRLYAGRLWVEVMLLRGVNDSRESLEDLAAVLREIEPDEVDLSVPVRPTAEAVEAADEALLRRVERILGRAARPRAAVEAARVPGDGAPGLDLLSAREGAVERALAIIARHPLAEDELRAALAPWEPRRVREALDALTTSGRARVLLHQGRRFWAGAAGRYAQG